MTDRDKETQRLRKERHIDTEKEKERERFWEIGTETEKYTETHWQRDRKTQSEMQRYKKRLRDRETETETEMEQETQNHIQTHRHMERSRYNYRSRSTHSIPEYWVYPGTTDIWSYHILRSHRVLHFLNVIFTIILVNIYCYYTHFINEILEDLTDWLAQLIKDRKIFQSRCLQLSRPRLCKSAVLNWWRSFPSGTLDNV